TLAAPDGEVLDGQDVDHALLQCASVAGSASAWTRRGRRAMKRPAAASPKGKRRADANAVCPLLAREPCAGAWTAGDRERIPNGVDRQPEHPPRTRGGRYELCLLQPARGGRGRPRRHLQAPDV